MTEWTEEIVKIIESIPKDYEPLDVTGSHKFWIKKIGNLNTRLLIMPSCWDIDVYEGDEYTVDKPKHRKYFMGSLYDTFLNSLKEAEEYINNENIIVAK